MALTLECICSPDASICALTQLVYVVDAIINQLGSIGSLNVLTLSTDAGSLGSIIDPSGHYEVNLPLGPTVAHWGSLSVSLVMNASLFQVPEPRFSQYHRLLVDYSIIQFYSCQNLVTGATSNRKIVSRAVVLGPTALCDGGDRGEVSGGISSVIYLSTPLGDCLSGAIGTTDSVFLPVPQSNMTDIGDSSQICLCVTGGSGAYSYSIVSGELPCGVTLNQVTGCLDGEADGTCPGTTSVTFRVTDNGGAAGTGTGGVTIGGTCRVFGSGATRITGGAWTSDMAGNPITINGNVYTVATVTPPDLMTVTGTIGIIDPTTWTYTSPVVPPPPPGPPEMAEVTCGFISRCPTSDTGLGGNSAY